MILCPGHPVLSDYECQATYCCLDHHADQTEHCSQDLPCQYENADHAADKYIPEQDANRIGEGMTPGNNIQEHVRDPEGNTHQPD